MCHSDSSAPATATATASAPASATAAAPAAALPPLPPQLQYAAVVVAVVAVAGVAAIQYTSATASATASATGSGSIPPVPGSSTATAGNNFLESTVPAVSAFAGVTVADCFAASLGQKNNDDFLSLSAGAGAVIGSTLNGLLTRQSPSKILESGVVGLTGAMAGYACGKYINAEYARAKTSNADPKQESTDSYALSNGGFAALGTGLFIGAKQMVRGVGTCKNPTPC